MNQQKLNGKYFFLVGCVTLTAVITSHAGVLHSGGEFDFEEGYEQRPSDLTARGYDVVGIGWGHFAQPAVWLPPQDRHGIPNFNENSYPINVSHGTWSQEITLSAANGDAIMWKTFTVPQGHHIRVTFDAITTPSEDDLQLRHALWQGDATVPFAVGDDPFAAPLQWVQWDINDTNNHFATYALQTVSTSTQMTYYFWVRHYWATPTGATLCIDNLVVYDDGPAEVATSTPTVVAVSPTPTPPLPTSTPTATETPPPVCTFHSADLNGNWEVDFEPALLLIQRFNQGGMYSCGTQIDGYQAGETGGTDCAPHDTDYNANWMLEFNEMLRFIQFFNTGYHCQEGTVDGYAPGRE